MLLGPRSLPDKLQSCDLDCAGEHGKMPRPGPHGVVVRERNIGTLGCFLQEVLANAGLIKNLGDGSLSWAALRKDFESDFSGGVFGLAKGREIARAAESLAIERHSGLELRRMVRPFPDA